jgi:hypothetical protein
MAYGNGRRAKSSPPSLARAEEALTMRQMGARIGSFIPPSGETVRTGGPSGARGSTATSTSVP